MPTSPSRQRLKTLSVDDATIAANLTAALQEQVQSGCPGAILDVSAPSLGFSFLGAQGLFDRQDSRQLRPDDGFRAASVTKAVTAVTAVRLAAEQRWSLDQPITAYLPFQIIDKLCQLEGLRTPDALTIRKLLNHSSGLPDYFFAPQFQAQMRQAPDRVWQPEELIQAAIDFGKQLFSPGTDFFYGDTAYVVVGLAIEQLLSCGLADAYRALVFDPLEMEDTYLECREPARGRELSHHLDF